MIMNWDILKGNWDQAVGHIKKKYADLTDDEIAEAKADGEILAGKLQEKYGYTKDEAQEKVAEIEADIKDMK